MTKKKDTKGIKLKDSIIFCVPKAYNYLKKNNLDLSQVTTQEALTQLQKYFNK
jgi:hypothetical protein